MGASQRPEVPEDEQDALLDEAIAVLRGILIGRPGLVRVRLELARAFFLKGEDGLAREHFERVLAGKPVLAVAANIGRFLTTIRARRRWNASFGFSLAPDSNIGAVSDEEIIYIHDLPFRRDADTSATSGAGVAVWGGGEYQHLLNDRLRLRACAGASRWDYAGKEFDQTFLSGHAGPRWLAGAPHSRELGARFEAEHRFAPRLRMSGRASWHRCGYRRESHLDGPVWNFSLGAARVITPTVRADAAASYARKRPDAVRWQNSSRWLRLGASVALPPGGSRWGEAPSYGGGPMRATGFPSPSTARHARTRFGS